MGLDDLGWTWGSGGGLLVEQGPYSLERGHHSAPEEGYLCPFTKLSPGSSY
jgi:hypothetical protein